MNSVSFTASLCLALTLSARVLAQGQPVDAYWSDRWNSKYHRFVDLDQDGTFLGDGEASFAVDPTSWASQSHAAALRVIAEDGQRVAYWLVEAQDRIARGVDADCDGEFSGAEITIFRDSGALDGESWPQDLDVTDDGAVWWVAGLVIAHPQNGLSRLQDLNGDGDAADAGEQVVMVDGTGDHVIEHDQGQALIADPWAFRNIASAGNGVVAFVTVDDQAMYRFEDFNGDGDVLDAGESILFLNATGAHPDLPMNPDFADGTLPNLLSQQGFYSFLPYMGSVMEDGERAFYFGTSANGANEAAYTNVDGVGINFLIFRGVDGNGDRDINDAGEVTIFFDGNQIDGDVPLLTLRGLDVLQDGPVYAVEIKPYPVLFPGENGNTWIHSFEDLNGDGDARDEGEQQFGLFDLQIHGYGFLFPIPPNYGNVMADPWDFSVTRAALVTDPADLDGSGAVDVADLVLVITAWGDCDGCVEDIDGNGSVDVGDLIAVITSWGNGACG